MFHANLVSISFAGNIPLLVAHLGCNFYLRLQNLTLGTPIGMLHIVEEDVRAAALCVDFIIARLNVVVPGSQIHGLWNDLKKVAFRYVTSCGTNIENHHLQRLFSQLGGQLTSELSCLLPSEVADVFGQLFAIVLMAAVAACEQQPVPHATSAYFESCDLLCRVCPTEEFQASVDTVRERLTKSFGGTLSSDDLDEIAKTALWQAQNFIYHFEPETLSHAMESVHVGLKDVSMSGYCDIDRSSFQAGEADSLPTGAEMSTGSVEFQQGSCQPSDVTDLNQSLREAMVQ